MEKKKVTIHRGVASHATTIGADGIYFATDTKEIYLNGQKYGGDPSLVDFLNQILSLHITNDEIHITADERTEWNSKQSALSDTQLLSVNSGITPTKVGDYDNHVANATIHVTKANKDTWNAKWDYDEATIKAVKVDNATEADSAKNVAWANTNHPSWIGDTMPTKSDIGLGNVGNFKAVSTVASQGLTTTEKSNARANIGAGTSNFSGSYTDLTNKPTIPSEVTESTVSGWGFTKNQGTYIKPNTGIPKSDLASTVQQSLDLADTALQTHQDISGKADLVDGKVPQSQLPSYVDDVLEYASKSAFPTNGESGKIYVAIDTNLTYRWSGSAYVEISPSLALGETSSTAYAGDKGKAVTDALNTHKTNTTIHITADERTKWNAKWNYDEATIKAVKVDSATESDSAKNVAWANTNHPSWIGDTMPTKSDIGLGNVGNFKAVSTVASQGLTTTEKSNARANIGAGTSNFSGSYTDLTNKPTIPSEVTESTVSGWGFTKNAGTLTGVKMNGAAKTITNGVVDLGTVITAHQDISGKQDSLSATQLNAANSGITATKVATYDNYATAIAGKADSADLADVATSGSYNDLTDKPSIPSAVTESTVSGWGFTKNVGTLTGVKMNGAAKTVTSGVVDLGTVITAHQDISGKSDVGHKHSASDITSGLADVATSGSYNDLTDKPSIPSAVTESTVSGWGFTKNTGSYSKPSTGIPKTDLASAVQTSLGKADSALQSFTETDPTVPSHVKSITSADITNWNSKTSNVGTITGATMNGKSVTATNGVLALGTVITAHQDISGKSDVGHKHSASDITSGLADVATSGSYNDLTDKPSIPSAVTETTVSGWGFTKNAGTVTKVNNVAPVNGNVTLSIPTVTDTYSATSSNAMSGKAVASAISGKADASAIPTDYVPNTRTINNKALSSNISLTAADVGATTMAAVEAKGYLTQHQSLANYYNKTEIDGKLSGAMHFKGTVATVAALPSTGNVIGDMWNVTATGANYAWDGSAWDKLSENIDLSGVVPTTRTVNGKALSSNITLNASDVGATTMTAVEAKGYLVASDISGKADSSSLAKVATSGSYSDLTNKPTIPSAVTETTVSGWGFTKNAGTLTGVKMNGAAKTVTSGVVDLGTVITAHQDISGKSNVGHKHAASDITSGLATVATSGSYSDLTNKPTIPSAVTETTVSGWGFTKNVGTLTGVKMNGTAKTVTSGVVDLGTVITAHQDISGKQDIITDLSTIRSNASNGATAYGWGNHATQGYLKSVAYDDLTTKPTATQIRTLVGNYVTTFGSKTGAITLRGGLTDNGSVNLAMSNNQLQASIVGLGSLAYKSSLAATDIPSLAWSKITSGKPTTLSGYGITDAKIANGVITLGSNTITPLTQHQSLAGYATETWVTNKGYLTGITKTMVDAVISYQAPITATNKLSASLVSGLATVATSGKYSDLSGTPTIPTTLPASDVYAWAKKSSLAATDVPTLAISKISGLQTALDNKLSLNGGRITDALFELYDDSYGYDIIRYQGNELYLDTYGELRLGGEQNEYALLANYVGDSIQLYPNHIIMTSNEIDISTPTLSVSGDVEIGGGLSANTYVTALSDARYKTNLHDVELAIEDIANAEAVDFDWTNGNGKSTGSIAQTWQKLLPNLVHEHNGKLTMEYANIALVCAIKLAREVKKLNETINKLKDNKDGN